MTVWSVCGSWSLLTLTAQLFLSSGQQSKYLPSRGVEQPEVLTGVLQDATEEQYAVVMCPWGSLHPRPKQQRSWEPPGQTVLEAVPKCQHSLMGVNPIFFRIS